MGCGITNLVARATARADELAPEDLRAGGRRLVAKVRRARPRFVAFLGLGAYRAAFGRRDAAPGGLPDPIAGATAWLLPNPSGLNAHYQVPDLAAAFRSLREAAGLPDRSSQR